MTTVSKSMFMFTLSALANGYACWIGAIYDHLDIMQFLLSIFANLKILTFFWPTCDVAVAHKLYGFNRKITFCTMKNVFQTEKSL